MGAREQAGWAGRDEVPKTEVEGHTVRADVAHDIYLDNWCFSTGVPRSIFRIKVYKRSGEDANANAL